MIQLKSDKMFSLLRRGIFFDCPTLAGPLFRMGKDYMRSR